MNEVCDTCPFRGQIESLEEWRRSMEGARLEDFRHVNNKLSEVHEKINTVANSVHGLTGKIIGAVAASFAAASVIAFLVTMALRHKA